MKKRVTIKDLANHLCLSISTVSRALADDKNIRQETKQLIFEAAEELGYRRNILASNLRKGQSHTIGAVFNESLAACGPEFINGINETFSENDINVIICSSGFSRERELSNMRMLDNFLVDGIIMHMYDKDENVEEIKLLQKHNIPIVFIGHAPDGMEVDSVVVNSTDKSYYLLDHLVNIGRRKILLVRDIPSSDGFGQMDNAYREICNKFKLEYDNKNIYDNCTSAKKAIELADKLIDENVEFDAIYAQTEFVAVAMMNRMRERGKTIPEDVAFAALVGTSFSTFVYPRLTSVEVDYHDMGRRTAEFLIEKMKNPAQPPKTITIESHIRFRESTTGNLSQN